MQNPITKKYILFFVVVVVLGAGSYFSERAFLASSAPSSTSTPLSTLRAVPDAPVEQTATAIAFKSIETPAAPTSTPTTAEAPNVTLSLPGTSYGVYVPPDTTVLEAMRMLASTTDFEFSGRTYPSLGFFVESLNGKSPENGYVWIFYVNGIKSGKGISSVTVNEGDMVEWKYEKSY